MTFSRSARIWTLLVIDSIFMLVELFVGYGVGSLALVADAFHMLNDVMSLVIALYAIQLSKNAATPKYSYGWHRAEILAALINGVFLLALCLSIFLEAINRFFAREDVTNPKMVVIVGSLGLLSNFLGLVLFHEHGHSHGHAHGDPETTGGKIETGGVSSDATETTPLLMPSADLERGTPMPRAADEYYGHPVETRARVYHAAEQAGYYPSSPALSMSPKMRAFSSGHRATSSPIRGRTISDPRVVPEQAVIDEEGPDIDAALTTQSLARHESAPAAVPSTPYDETHGHHHETASSSDSTALPSDSHSHSHGHGKQLESRHGHSHSHEHITEHHGHGHSHGSHGGGHGHSHSSMNMQALVLHVMGDALGNVGVIASGLIIWLTDWKYKQLSDPIISLVITSIIFASALPLVKSASFILLQGVPGSIDLEELREEIYEVRGVKSVHELHVWQLSESKIISSVHVTVASKDDFMRVAAEIRKVLHRYNIHSAAIQPELEEDVSQTIVGGSSPSGEHCLLPCAPGSECPPDAACCPPASNAPSQLHSRAPSR